MSYRLNQKHVDYVLSDYSSSLNRFDNLFPLLDSINPYDRRWFFPSSLIKSQLPVHEVHTEKNFLQERLEREYGAFKSELVQRFENGIPEYSVVYAYVNETLNVLRWLACPQHAASREASLRQTLAIVQSMDDEAFGNLRRISLIAKLEEMLLNLRANAQLYGTRYELFCNEVAGKMVPELSTVQCSNF